MTHRRSSAKRSAAVSDLLLQASGHLIEPSPNPNLSNFRGADQYFTILFNHYREDFTGPLRKAINEFRKFETHILYPRGKERPIIEGGHYFQVLKFDGNDLTVSMADYKTLQKDDKWNRSKHLQSNALVALSNDCFVSWTYAVVVRDERPGKSDGINQNTQRFNGFRKQRVITIKPYQEITLDHLRVGSLWLIVPDSYFESCRPVLERIRLVHGDRSLLPFKEYIIDKSPNVSRPQYLVNKDVESSVAGFDESQQDALRHALTHEVALVQGAPGTGKTHVGVNLIRILSSLHPPPKIMIISYTNHAVDNFVLECERAGVNVGRLVRLGEHHCQDMARFLLDTRMNQWRKDVPAVLMRANIIAMTTTGGAKNQSRMEQARPQVVLVEEAAHITEAHLIAALPASCQHLIMLGDYWQLKPHITEHAKKFLLDVPLFERLIRVGLPSAELKLQYRMHPALANVMVPHIYPTLDSAPRCNLYPLVKGVPERVVFFTHESTDEVEDERTTKSRINDFERGFLCRFCQYLLRQGHKESSITILSIYKEQVHAIFDGLKKLEVKVTEETSRRKPEQNSSRRASTASTAGGENETEGVRVTTVDKYQGEENDIVLMSFAASSPTAFLDINRVSAALSCARHGFYAMGNFKVYCDSANRKLDYHLGKEAHYAEADAIGRSRARNVKLWPLLYTQWIKQKVLRSYMPIRCEKHNKTREIKNVPSFDIYSPEGGCQMKCTERSCAHHYCARHCHPDDNHTHFCSKLTTIVINKGERIQKTCDELKTYRWQGTELVEITFAKCNHKRLLPYAAGTTVTARCVEKVSRSRPGCGHSETVNCGEPFSLTCETKLTVALDGYGCQHKYSLSCSNNKRSYLEKVARQCKIMVKFTCPYCKNSEDVECNAYSGIKCQKRVAITLLPCGHRKNIVCGTRRSITALTCKEIVGLTMACGHSTTIRCCEKEIFRSCMTLIAQVRRACGHSITNVYCHEKMVKLRQPCLVRCTTRLPCGHSVSYACHEKDEYERGDYRCLKLLKLTRPCRHEQVVHCCDLATVRAAPCRSEVTTGYSFWKKRYECHEYEHLKSQQWQCDARRPCGIRKYRPTIVRSRSKGQFAFGIGFGRCCYSRRHTFPLL